MHWIGSDALVAELVDALGSWSSVHWTWEFKSPLFIVTILRKCNSTQTLSFTSTPFPTSQSVGITDDVIPKD